MIKNIIILIISILILNTVSLPQGDGLIIGENYRIFPGSTSQSEVFITKHPGNPEILFSSANTGDNTSHGTGMGNYDDTGCQSSISAGIN